MTKGYIVYLTTHLLPVNNNLPLHLFWSKLQYYYIMISSLRSKRFRGAKSKERGFRSFARAKKWGKSKNRKVGEGSEGILVANMDLY